MLIYNIKKMNKECNKLLNTFAQMNRIILAFNYIDKKKSGDDLTIFNVMWKPSISIRNYVRRIYIHMFNNINMLLVTIHYMALYVKNTKIKINCYNFYKLFLTASSLAHKFWEDESYSNNDIAKIGGVSIKMLHKLEKQFLKDINWNLYIRKTPLTNEDLYNDMKYIINVDYKQIIQRTSK